MPAQVTVETSSGMPHLDGAGGGIRSAPPAAASVSAMRASRSSSERIGTTASNGVAVLDREGAQAEHGRRLVEQTARIQDGRVDGEDAGTADQAHRTFLDAGGPRQIGLQIGDGEGIQERK